MSAEAWLVLTYAVIIGAIVTAAVVRHEPTALRGRSLFLLTTTFALIWVGTVVVGWRRPSIVAAAVVGAAVTITFAMRRRWLLVRATPRAVDESIAGSARRLLLVCDGVPGSRRIVCSALVLEVRATPIGRIGTGVTVPTLPRDRKLDLFRKLLGKQYRSAVPLPTFRL